LRRGQPAVRISRAAEQAPAATHKKNARQAQLFLCRVRQHLKVKDNWKELEEGTAVVVDVMTVTPSETSSSQPNVRTRKFVSPRRQNLREFIFKLGPSFLERTMKNIASDV
jgi:hypothetical protein